MSKRYAMISCTELSNLVHTLSRHTEILSRHTETLRRGQKIHEAVLKGCRPKRRRNREEKVKRIIEFAQLRLRYWARLNVTMLAKELGMARSTLSDILKDPRNGRLMQLIEVRNSYRTHNHLELKRGRAGMRDTRPIKIKGRCMFTGKEHTVSVPYAGFVAWQNGELIQNAMPGVSADDREFLISGVGPEGFTLIGPDLVEIKQKEEPNAED